MRGIFWVLVLLALPVAGAVAVAPDEAPAVPGEWGYRPFDGMVSAVTPPGFVFRPQAEASRYAVQVSLTEDFAEIFYEAADLHYYCHCPAKIFPQGTYYWRFAYADKDGVLSDWSSIRSFSIDDASVAFPMPSRDELLSRIAEGHPRLFIRPEEIGRYRELAQGDLANLYTGLVSQCEKLLAKSPDITEPPKYDEATQRATNPDAWRQRWWGNRERVVAVTNGAATLAFTWMLDGNEKYAAEARRLLLAACSWDPVGATGYRYNDEAGMPFAYFTARAYTWLHDYLSEEDRQKVRDCMAVRGGEMYNHLAGRKHIWYPYASHANRAWHYLGEVGAAFNGEIEGADEWAWFAMNVFYNSYPVWNDYAGGWHEGMAYWSSYITRVTWWLATLGPTFGIDGYKKPFFSNIGNFPLYVVPPGESMGGFGDLTYGYNAGKVSGLLTTLARSAGNPYWLWLAEQTGGASLPGGYIGFVQAALPPLEPKAPVDMPTSMLFPGIGVAALHSNLVNREQDVAFLMKSSPMGNQSHGYESQNAFMMSVAGDPVFIRTGRRDLYGSPHHQNWMWDTKSVNSITVNGLSQTKHSNQPLGEIHSFHTSDSFDYMVGDCGQAYGDALKRFTRAVLFIKPHTIVIFDALEANEPATFEYWLHAPHEMQVDGGLIRASGQTEKGAAYVMLMAPTALDITQTDTFDPMPGDWVKLTQYHLRAATTEKRDSMEFVSVIRPFLNSGPEPALGTDTAISENSIGCEVTLGEGRKAIVVWRKAGTADLTYGNLSTDGDIACVIVDVNDNIENLYVHGGTSLTYGEYRAMAP